jgi:hypothetical protein
MLADSASQGRRPGTSRNFIASAAAIMTAAIVVKIAIPPPRGTALWANLSEVGCATNPMRSARFFAMAVKMTDSANEPASKITADMVNVSILTAPVNAFLLY